jgi:acyl dehydratase
MSTEVSMPSVHEAAAATVHRYGSFSRQAHVSSSRAAAYAAATNDANPLYDRLGIAPPVFAAVLSWDVLVASITELVGGEIPAHVIHRAQDMHLYRPLPLEQDVSVSARTASIQTMPSAAQVCTHLAASDSRGELLFEIYCTTLLGGVGIPAVSAPGARRDRWPRATRSALPDRVVVHVDDDQPCRYSDASGDSSPIHLDDDAARAVGFPGRILHGLCAMAMCGAALVRVKAAGDPTRLRRLGVRFSAPIFPGDDMHLAIFEAGSMPGTTAVCFEVKTGVKTALRDGVAEIQC